MTTPVTALAPVARQLFLNPSNGQPASGFLLYTYAAGTTSPLATYTDSTGATENTNPIVLDTLGECDLWLTPLTAYKLLFTTPTDTDPPTNPIWVRDQIMSAIPSASNGGGGGGPSLCPNSLLVTTALEMTVDGNGSVPSTGICGDIYCPFVCTITASVLQAKQAGNVVLDIWVAPFANNSPPTSGNSIVASDPPTLSSSQGVIDNTLTGWSVAIPAQSWIRYSITSVSTLTRFTSTLVAQGTVNFS